MGVIGIHVRGELLVHPGVKGVGGIHGSGGGQRSQGIVAVAEGHKITGVLIQDILVGNAGEISCQIGVPLRCDAHPVRHFVADGKGQGNGMGVGIHSGFAGKGHGNAGDTHGGVHVCPAQLLYGKGGAGKYRQVLLVNQIVKTVSGGFRGLPEGGCVQAAVGIPGNKKRQLVGFVPVIGGGIDEVGGGNVGINGKTNVLGKGTAVLIQTVKTRMQAPDKGHCCHDPAQPLDKIPTENDHQHHGADNQHHQSDGQHLPQQEIYTAGPLSQKVLNHAAGVGVDHVC